jgi:hypothetical protein
MSRSKRIFRGALFGVAAFGLLLSAMPAQAQISCERFCRFVPCPDAPSTPCLDPSFNETTCFNWGECFPIEGFQTSLVSKAERPSACAGDNLFLAALAESSAPSQAAR